MLQNPKPVRLTARIFGACKLGLYACWHGLMAFGTLVFIVYALFVKTSLM